MFNPPTRHLKRRYVVVGFMIAAIALMSAAGVGDNPCATGCCDTCDSSWNECRLSCYEAYSSNDPALSSCLTTCRNRQSSCLSHCEMCDVPSEGRLVRQSPGTPPRPYSICFDIVWCAVDTITGERMCYTERTACY